MHFIALVTIRFMHKSYLAIIQDLVILLLIEIAVLVAFLLVLVLASFLTYSYKFRFVPSMKLTGFAISVVSFALTEIFSDFIKISPKKEVQIGILKLNVVFGVVSLVLLALIFNQNIYGYVTRALTGSALVTSLILFGITIGDLIFDNSNIVIFLLDSNGYWDTEFTLTFLIMILISVIFAFGGVYHAVKFQNSFDLPLFKTNQMKYSKNSVLLFLLGMIILVLSLFIDPYIPMFLEQLLDFSSLGVLISAVVTMTVTLIQSPFSLMYMKQGSDVLIRQKLIGWALFSNEDNGPVLKMKSKEIFDTLNISEEELFHFGVQSLVISSNEEKFAHSVSLTPFLGNDKIISVGFSFDHLDPNLKDSRFQGRAMCFFTLLIPSIFLSIFSKPIGELQKLLEIIDEQIKSTKSILEFTEEGKLHLLTNNIIRQMF